MNASFWRSRIKEIILELLKVMSDGALVTEEYGTCHHLVNSWLKNRIPRAGFCVHINILFHVGKCTLDFACIERAPKDIQNNIYFRP